MVITGVTGVVKHGWFGRVCGKDVRIRRNLIILTMILSQNSKKRYDQIMEQLWLTTRSMDIRAVQHARWQSIFDKGAAGVIKGRLNKLSPAIKKQAALLFAPSIMKFELVIPPDEDDADTFVQVDSVNDAIRTEWDSLELDQIFSMSVLNSLILGCYIISLTPQRRTDWEIELRADVIHPRDFGVGKETGTNSWKLSNQYASAVRTYHTLEELSSWLGNKEPRRQELLNKLSFVAIDRGMTSSRITGMAPGATMFQSKPENWPSHTASSGEDIPSRLAAEMYELRIFDDEIGDWRVFRISGSVILSDRRAGELGVPNCLPYVKICGDESSESFWGISLVDNLSPLQEWYLSRTEGMDEKFRQSLRPPTAAIGLGGGFEERLRAFSKAGGRIAVPNQNARIERFKPEMSEQDFAMMQMIAEQLDEQSELSPALRGRNQPGVRSEGLAGQLMSLASAEILTKSFRIEKQAAALGQLLFESLRRYDTHKITDKNGKRFFLSEFPSNVKVKIDGHSSSPIAVQDHKLDAKWLVQMGIITPSRAIRMVSPVMEQSMLRELRDIEFAKMVAAEQVKMEQQAKRGGKASAGGREALGAPGGTPD